MEKGTYFSEKEKGKQGAIVYRVLKVRTNGYVPKQYIANFNYEADAQLFCSIKNNKEN